VKRSTVSYGEPDREGPTALEKGLLHSTDVQPGPVSICLHRGIHFNYS